MSSASNERKSAASKQVAAKTGKSLHIAKTWTSNLVMAMTVVLLITCVVQLISVILNGLGIYFLRKVPSLMSNQQLELLPFDDCQYLRLVFLLCLSLLSIYRCSVSFET